MEILLDYFLLVINRLVEILDSISFNGSVSLLYYLLGAIIIGFIIKLIKGGSNEFEHSFNFSTPAIVTTATSRYVKDHRSRKQQIVKQKAFTDGFTAGMTFTFKDEDNKKFTQDMIGKYY